MVGSTVCRTHAHVLLRASEMLHGRPGERSVVQSAVSGPDRGGQEAHCKGGGDGGQREKEEG